MSQFIPDENSLVKKMQDLISSPSKDVPLQTASEDIFAGIPKNVKPAENQALSTHTDTQTTQKMQVEKPKAQADERSITEKMLRALWTIASTISMLVNIVVVIILLAVYQNYTVLKIPEGIGLDTPKDLLKGLFDNFQLMDQAHITTNILVQDEIPVRFTLGLNQQTSVILSEDVTIDGARVALTTGGLNIFNAPATVVLPAGTSLPIFLNLEVPVDEMIPITLNVPVDIALNETDLHQPFTGLQTVVEPLYCLVSSNALDLNGAAICP